MSDPNDHSAEAIVENEAIVIRIPLANLQVVLDGGWACNAFDKRYKITDLQEFSKELCGELNREDEQGTTPIHRLFDQGINDALNQGAFGIDEHPDQEGGDVEAPYTAFCEICRRVSQLTNGLCGVCSMDEDMQGLMDRDMGDS